MSRSAGVGLVGRRRAPDRGRHPRADQPLPVAGGHAGRLSGQAAPPQRGEQEVAAPVAGEDPPGPVAAVRGRGQAEDQHPGVLVAPAGDRAAPVALGREGPALDRGDLLPPRHQPRAGPAHRLPRGQLAERARARGQVGHLAGGRGDRCLRRGRVRATRCRAAPARPGLAVGRHRPVGYRAVRHRAVRHRAVRHRAVRHRAVRHRRSGTGGQAPGVVRHRRSGTGGHTGGQASAASDQAMPSRMSCSLAIDLGEAELGSRSGPGSGRPRR